MSGFALIRAAALLFLGLFFLYAGLFNPHLLYEGGSSQPTVSEHTGRLFGLGLGLGSVLFGSWIIRRQLRAAPLRSKLGLPGKLLVGLAVVVALAGVGYASWYRAQHASGPAARHQLPASPSQAGDGGPAPAPAPLPPGS